MATDAVSWVIFVLIGFLVYPDLIPKVSGWNVHTENTSHRIQVVDNDPEFLVGVRGVEKPFCFHLESPRNDVIRLLQDPISGIIINARVFHDRHNNKSYLGTIFLRGEDVRILAKQELVVINDLRYEWDGMKALDVRGHRVIVGANMVAVTFRQKNITLIVRRHFVNKDTDVPFNDDMHTVADNDVSENKNGDDASGDKIVSYNEGRGDSPPVVSLRRRRKTRGDNILYHSLVSENDASKHSPTSEDLKHFTSITDVQDDKIHAMNKRSAHEGHRRSSHGHKLREKRHRNSHFVPNGDRLHGITTDDRHAHISTHVQADGNSGTVYLGVYISDSRDFSNSTHGLLGQFLFKNVTLEKILIKNGKIKARFIIDRDPTRRTIAPLSLRRNVALNVTRACWRVRHQGRVVIDGAYKDYVVPSLRYNLMMKLPPHTPL